jgi:hypothetical protein
MCFEHCANHVGADLDTPKNHNSFNERKRDFLRSLFFGIFNDQVSASFFEIECIFGKVEEHERRKNEILRNDKIIS